MAAPVSITFGGGAVGLPANLIYTTTQNLTTRLTFPPGAITQPLTLTLQPALAVADTATIFAGHAFKLVAEQRGLVQPGLQFGTPVTVTIQYSDHDLRAISDESRLSLRWWTGIKWQDASKRYGPTRSIARAAGCLSLAVCRVVTSVSLGDQPVCLNTLSCSRTDLTLPTIVNRPCIRRKVGSIH
jgi:hypothetical protein